MKLRITGALLDERSVDIDIDSGFITGIRDSSGAPGDGEGPAEGQTPAAGDPRKEGRAPGEQAPERTIDAAGYYAVPSLKNGHTHAAMTLVRGFADDMKLGPWLEEKIWPLEAQLEPEDIYWGTRLAALEMIKSGTTFCNDMYLDVDASRRAYRDAGIKAAVGAALFDFEDEQTAARIRKETEALYRRYGGGDGRLLFVPAPHSLYTVGEKTLRWLAEFGAEHELPIHIHLSETRDEVENCMAAHEGLRPAEYLDRVGLLSPRLVAAHSIWLSRGEIELLAERGVTVVHNPVSNMKLASGSCFPFREMRDAGVPMMLGTDGCSSNNNLDMFEEMKCASLLQKHHHGDTERMSAGEILRIAAGGGTGVFPNIAGRIEEGAPADLLLIGAQQPAMTPAFNPASNLVYSVNGSAVDSVICGGEILMRGRKVPGEEEVLEKARERARLLAERAGR
jgi:5-methylthioadenosine/S-adenosylhomocysteine deaminase